MAADTSTTVTLEGGHWYLVTENNLTIEQEDVKTGNKSIYCAWYYIPIGSSTEVYPFIPEDNVYMEAGTIGNTCSSKFFSVGRGKHSYIAPYAMLVRMVADGYLSDVNPHKIRLPSWYSFSLTSVTLSPSKNMSGHILGYVDIESIGNPPNSNIDCKIEGKNAEIYLGNDPKPSYIKTPNKDKYSRYLDVNYWSGKNNVSENSKALTIASDKLKFASSFINKMVHDGNCDNFISKLSALNVSHTTPDTKIVTSGLLSAGNNNLKPAYYSVAGSLGSLINADKAVHISTCHMRETPLQNSDLVLHGIYRGDTGALITKGEGIKSRYGDDGDFYFTIPYASMSEQELTKNQYYPILFDFEVLPSGGYEGARLSACVQLGIK